MPFADQFHVELAQRSVTFEMSHSERCHRHTLEGTDEAHCAHAASGLNICAFQVCFLQQERYNPGVLFRLACRFLPLQTFQSSSLHQP